MSVHAASSALTDALQEQHVYYELIPHRRTQSAAAEARAIGVDPGHVAKTLVQTGEGSCGLFSPPPSGSTSAR